MASLQCIKSVKERSLSSLEAALTSNSLIPRRPSSRPTHTKLYDIEIVAEDGPKVKVHYVGYEERYDEWKMKEDVILRQPEQPVYPDFNPLTELACLIKRKLLPSRHEDPNVRIQVPGTEEAFSILRSRGKQGRTKETFTISSCEDLEDILGSRWYLRIANRNGDFSYVVPATVQYYIAKPKKLIEYDAKYNQDGTIAFEPMYVEQCCSIVFRFVRGDGNKMKLKDFL